MTTLIRDAFLDLVFQDEDLVRAEFDAIVAAAWPEPPAPPPPAAPPAPDDHPAGAPVSHGWWPPGGRRMTLPEPARPRRGRQRAPPTWK
jgi:hypothetical protein